MCHFWEPASQLHSVKPICRQNQTYLSYCRIIWCIFIEHKWRDAVLVKRFELISSLGIRLHIVKTRLRTWFCCNSFKGTILSAILPSRESCLPRILQCISDLDLSWGLWHIQAEKAVVPEYHNFCNPSEGTLRWQCPVLSVWVIW